MTKETERVRLKSFSVISIKLVVKCVFNKNRSDSFIKSAKREYWSIRIYSWPFNICFVGVILWRVISRDNCFLLWYHSCVIRRTYVKHLLNFTVYRKRPLSTRSPFSFLLGCHENLTMEKQLDDRPQVSWSSGCLFFFRYFIVSATVLVFSIKLR